MEKEKNKWIMDNLTNGEKSNTYKSDWQQFLFQGIMYRKYEIELERKKEMISNASRLTDEMIRQYQYYEEEETMGKICTQCGAMNTDGSTTCSRCGNQLQQGGNMPGIQSAQPQSGWGGVGAQPLRAGISKSEKILKNKRNLVIVAVAIIVLVGIVIYQSAPQRKILGQWETIVDGEEFTITINKKHVIFEAPYYGQSEHKVTRITSDCIHADDIFDTGECYYRVDGKTAYMYMSKEDYYNEKNGVVLHKKK